MKNALAAKTHLLLDEPVVMDMYISAPWGYAVPAQCRNVFITVIICFLHRLTGKSSKQCA